MSEQKKYTKKEAIKIISKAAEIYKKELLNNDILFIFKDNNKIKIFIANYTDANFLHFTGMKINNNITKRTFFEKSLNGQLKETDFSFKDIILTSKKLDVLEMAMKVQYIAKMGGEFHSNGIKIKADTGVGTQNFSMTFGAYNNLFVYPISVLKEDIRKITTPTSPIIAILCKKNKEKYFDTITYKSKNINIDKLHFPKEIKELLSEKALYELKPSLSPQEQSLEKAPETASKALGKANNKIIESIAFAEVLSPTSTIEIPSQNKTLSEVAITKEETPQKNTLTNRLAQSKEKAEEQNQQNKKQQNIDNLEH